MSKVEYKKELPREFDSIRLSDELRQTGTDSSQAITLNSPRIKVTSSTTNLAADTTELITITNSCVRANSNAIIVVGGGGNGFPVLGKVTFSSGSMTVSVRNVNASTACNAAYTLTIDII